MLRRLFAALGRAVGDRSCRRSPLTIAPGVHAIPVPGHTRGSVVYLLDDHLLFSGDSLAWSARERELVAFKDACWYSWTELTASLGDLRIASNGCCLAMVGRCICPQKK